jgi:hypothetical protein
VMMKPVGKSCIDCEFMLEIMSIFMNSNGSRISSEQACYLRLKTSA